MKKIIAIILCICLVFSFSITSFAVTADEQSTTLKSGWGSGTTNSYPTGYNTSWFYRVLYWLSAIETSANSLVDSNGDIYGELSHIDSSIGAFLGIDVGYIQEDINVMQIDLTNMRTTLGNIYNYVQASDTELNRIYSLLEDFDSYLSDIVSDISSIDSSVDGLVSDIDTIKLYLTNTLNARLNEFSGYLGLMTDDVSMLQQVLADEDDLAFKQSQKDNQEAIFDTFFSAESDLSINLTDLEAFGHYIRDYKNSFNFRENVGTDSPLTVLSEGSDFMEIFTVETGQSMDPTFGGGGTDPDPDPEPDPDPDPEPEPIKNWLPLATTEPGGTEIYNGIGYKPNTRWSSSGGAPSDSLNHCLSGWIPVSSSDIVYLYRFLLSVNQIYSSLYAVKYDDGSVSITEIADYPTDDNGVLSFVVPDNVSYVRFSVGEFTSDSIITINQYPIQTSNVNSYSLRSTAPVDDSQVVVTSYYADREAEFQRFIRGDFGD